MVPQPRIPEGDGIAAMHTHTDAQFCLDTWKSQFVDMVLLAQSDILVAGRYSSFTQSLPRSIQFEKASSSGRRGDRRLGVFCEVGMEGRNMECFDNFEEWWLRKSTLPVIGDPQDQQQKGGRHIFFVNISEVTKEKLESIFEGTAVTLDYTID
jgi:hypothetical protein